MRPVKLAIAGCGIVTEEYHLPAALGSRHVQVAALVDRNADRARLLMRTFGCDARLASSLDAVGDDVEGVIVATPNDTHAEVAGAALDRGLPVLIEKPVATTYRAAAELCQLARRRNTFISVGFMTRHFPVVALVKNLITTGFLGRLERFHFEYGTRGGWAPVSGYNLDRARSGGGVLVVSGTHFIDRMLFWFGYPRRFRYFDDSYGGVEANCKADLEFDGPLTGTLFFSKTMALRNALYLETDRYRVELPWGEAQQLTHAPTFLKVVPFAPTSER